MLAAFVLLAALAQSPGRADLDARFCESARDNQAQLRPRLPITDNGERLDSFTPDCGQRLLVWERALVADPGLSVDQWRARREAGWSHIVCEIPRFRDAVGRGWRFTESIVHVDGSRHEFTARCG